MFITNICIQKKRSKFENIHLFTDKYSKIGLYGVDISIFDDEIQKIMKYPSSLKIYIINLFNIHLFIDLKLKYSVYIMKFFLIILFVGLANSLKIISSKVAGLKGFYMLGVSKFIKENYDLQNTLFMVQVLDLGILYIYPIIFLMMNYLHLLKV